MLRYNPFKDIIFMAFLIGSFLRTIYDMVQVILGRMPYDNFINHFVPVALLIIIGLVFGFAIHQLTIFLTKR